MIAIGQFDLQTLLGLAERLALLVDAFLRLRTSGFDSRQMLLLRRQPHIFLLDARIGQRREFRPARALGIVASDIGLPLRPVGLQLRQARLVFLARFAPVAYFSFQPRHFGIGLIAFSLCALHAVRG